MSPPRPSATPARVYLGLGSNLGVRQRMIDAALERIAAQEAIELVAHTGTIETEPWGVEDQPRFLNAVAEISTTLSPLELLRVLKRIERQLGRRPGGPRWGPREIDLDILLVGDLVIETPELTIPHPRLRERRFVLEQIVQLNGGLIHPVDSVPLAKYLEPS